MTGKRLVVAMVSFMCGLMWGFPPRIIALAVEHMGPTRALVWFAMNMPRYLVTTAVLGWSVEMLMLPVVKALLPTVAWLVRTASAPWANPAANSADTAAVSAIFL